MEQLSLKNCLELKDPSVVSFYGAGGKSTLLQRLADELVSVNQKVLLTTTTKIYKPEMMTLFISNQPIKAIDSLSAHFKNNNSAVLGKRILEDGKIEGFTSSAIKYLQEKLSINILVEADGARGKSIKGYAANEPVIPACSDLIAAVLGADVLGEKLSDEIVHRLETFLKATGAEKNNSITLDLIAGAYENMLCLGKQQAPKADLTLILNKIDKITNQGLTMLDLIQKLNRNSLFNKLLATRALAADPVKVIMNNRINAPPVSVSCVVLAAGRAKRMGTDKLALKIGHKTVIEKTLDHLVQSGFEEIIVVTGPENNWQSNLDSKRFRLVNNPDYRNGLSSSLIKGLSKVDARSQGVLFALGDQPSILPETYKLLVKTYQNNLKLVTCPLYRGKRGNPTLFDRRTWPDLMGLSGDRGGRMLLRKLPEHSIDYIETNRREVIIDIDTPDDYRQLLNNH